MLSSNKSPEDLLEELKYYNLLYQHNINNSNFIMPHSFYYGIDPNNDFIHLGHISNLFAIKIISKFIKKFILVIGDFTSTIGDPSFKEETRHITDNNKHFVKTISKNFEVILKNLNVDYEIKYNSAWSNIRIDKYISYASLFNVREIYSSEIFKNRILKKNPIYLQEFIYPTIQAYDYLYLYENYKCTLQVGGQDQWTNILSGGQVIRKLYKDYAYTITTPLITNSSGHKIGKSTGNVFKIDICKNIFFNISSLMNTSDEIINKIKSMLQDGNKITDFFSFVSYMLSIMYSNDISDRIMLIYKKLYSGLENFNELALESIDDLIVRLEDNFSLLKLCKLLDDRINSKILNSYIDNGFIKINFVTVQSRNIINHINSANQYIVLGLKKKFIVFKKF